MFGRKRRQLEQRVTDLEERLDVRKWELPPENLIPYDDLPEYPDYSVTCWTEDEDVEGWNPRSPYGYL
jgi:hypothetical protein